MIGLWRFGLLDCISVPLLTLLVCCCAPIRWASTMSRAGLMAFWGTCTYYNIISIIIHKSLLDFKEITFHCLIVCLYSIYSCHLIIRLALADRGCVWLHWPWLTRLHSSPRACGSGLQLPSWHWSVVRLHCPLPRRQRPCSDQTEVWNWRVNMWRFDSTYVLSLLCHHSRGKTRWQSRTC